MNIPQFATKDELFRFLKTNKSMLIAEKKYQTKHGDVISYFVTNEEGNELVNKGTPVDPAKFNGNEIKVSVVVNTTNILDSHGDVHFPNIWNKSLKEKKDLYLLQEHQMNFANVISDEVKAMTKTMTWRELGVDAFGVTQALVFVATIKKNRNEFMFNQYLNGYVKNHSVGMRYVNIELALNSGMPEDAEEKAVWDKYINDIVNRQSAEENGYFWAVTEAKLIEGSAVVIGSNTITPTLSVEEKSTPSEDTLTDLKNAPSEDTQRGINYKELRELLKNKTKNN